MSPDGYNDNVYSSYRPTSAELRADAGNVPPGRFREEVTRGSSESAYDETDPITSYVVGTTIVTVSDWNSLGHTATVETQRSDGGGSQLLTDDEDGSQYRRYWAEDEWSEWEAGGGGGGIPDSIQPLETDAFEEADGPEVYPVGVSVMPVTGAAGWNDSDEDGIVFTVKTATTFDQWHTSQRFTGVRSFWDDEMMSWQSIMLRSTADNRYILKSDVLLDDDSRAPADSIDDYPWGTSHMYVYAASDWNSTGVDGMVVTEVFGSIGGQRFYTNAGARYTRNWNGTTWTAFA